MNKYIVLSFILGCVAGVTGTYIYMEKKVTSRINEKLKEIEADIFTEPIKEGPTYYNTNDDKDDIDVENRTKYEKIISDNKYALELSVAERAKAKPFIVPPEKFGEDLDYDIVSYTYFSDGVIADENDMIVSDIEGSIGNNAHLHFGEYEPDIVYIQNDRLKTYYELCMDRRNYADLLEDKPYLKTSQLVNDSEE